MAASKKPQDGGQAAEGAKNAYEYAFEPVPESKRKTGISLFMVLAGYPIAVSNFVTGAAVGYRMPFAEATAAFLCADAFLIAVAIMMGLAAFATGYSTAFLSRMVFGKRGSAIFSALIVLSSVTWIGINGNTFGSMVTANFPAIAVPSVIIGVVIILVWSISAAHGYKGMEIVSWMGVPTAVAMGVICFVMVGMQSGGYGSLLSFAPPAGMEMGFTDATASIVGSWLFGCLIAADVCRFAKSKRHVVVCCAGAFLLGLFGFQMVGCVVAQIAQNPNFSEATALMGLGYLVLACTLVCLCTTQDNNIYGAGLAMQNILSETKLGGKVTHTQMAVFITALSSVLALCNILDYLLPVITFLSVLLSPVPALIVSERVFVKHPKMGIMSNPVALACWIAGGIVGQVCLSANFFVPPVVSFLFTMVLYTAASKVLDGKLLAGRGLVVGGASVREGAVAADAAAGAVATEGDAAGRTD
ncbi:purine-cytosine permease family protein [Adlercreutzia aquisgranensis]|uniref:purine-cytosine permease family protein n=1 Tax=Adlercreutzia aquisgranensis TaxID=2941323 RepID=UPI00203F9C4D|nr:cytosine permease [Adlercreutzia aquisgranensis]